MGASSGNGGSSEYSYPASYDNVVSVAAIDITNTIAGFSQHNDQVTIAAPGVSVKSTDGNDSGYNIYSGTSMASPHVAALVSLLWNQFPTCTNTEIIEALKQGALDLGTAGYDNYYGHGAARYYPSRDALAAGCGNTGPVSPIPTKAPTTPTTSSPSSTTSPLPQYWAVCPKSGECDEEDTISESSEWHTVRCCSDEEKPGWKKNDGCDVWGQSLIDKTCSIHESHSLALGICLSAGARLCTKEELAAECTADSGCGADNRLAWSSSSAAQGPTASPTSKTTGINTPSPTTTSTVLPTWAPTSATTLEPTSAPTLEPTLEPTSTPTPAPTPKPTPVPTLAPTLPVAGQCASETDGDSTTLNYWALCGRQGAGRCSNEPDDVFAYDVPHEVRCCSDVAKDGWTKRSGCNVWAESNFGVCHTNKNFLEAECICEKYDARLCTKAEIEGNCSRGTGCGRDNQLVWTSTEE